MLFAVLARATYARRPLLVDAFRTYAEACQCLGARKPLLLNYHLYVQVMPTTLEVLQ